MNDTLRLLIMATVKSIFPVLLILGVLPPDMTEIAIGAIILMIDNFVALFAYVVKYGQQASGSTSTVTASITTEPKP